jgi:hypothetical protein
MCIIIYKPKGKAVPLERLFASKDRNPHGFGVSWANDKKVKTFRTMDFDRFLEKYSTVSQFDCMLHFRYATKGRKDRENCHPFKVVDGLVMTHNGTMPNLEGISDARSDSRALVELYLRPMVKKQKGFCYTDSGKRWMTALIGSGNKLCFMNRHGNPSFVNGDLGHWSMGCWYSNKSYERTGGIVAPNGYKFLARKKASAEEIVGMPITYGRQRFDSKSIIDDMQDDLDLYADIEDDLGHGCNTSEGFDCSEENTL